MCTSPLIQQFHFEKFALKEKIQLCLKNKTISMVVLFKMQKLWKEPKIYSVWNWLKEIPCLHFDDIKNPGESVCSLRRTHLPLCSSVLPKC